jgi:hypothetical protein
MGATAFMVQDSPYNSEPRLVNFLLPDGTFDRNAAIAFQAKIAGECYEPEGWDVLQFEDPEKTDKRTGNTLTPEHQTPYEHIVITMEIVGPKILMMVLNNEKQNTTSEKSARYTAMDISSNLSLRELELYEKWLHIFKGVIDTKYGNVFKADKIVKLAQENARYLCSVFTTTRMVHSVPWIQLNRVARWMTDFYDKYSVDDSFYGRIAGYMGTFVRDLDKLNLLDERAMSNRKERQLSLFTDLSVDEQYGWSYSTHYPASFAQLAQAHRHRTISYSMLPPTIDNPRFFIPPIVAEHIDYSMEWLNDMHSVADVYPQGMIVDVNEQGTIQNFVLKCKERLCSAAQLEIMIQTKNTLDKMHRRLSIKEGYAYLADLLEPYTHGARCTFPDYTCMKPCAFAEGIDLTRTI